MKAKDATSDSQYEVVEHSETEFVVSESPTPRDPSRPILKCRSCGKQNRLPSNAAKARCGACGEELGAATPPAPFVALPQPPEDSPRFSLPIQKANQTTPTISTARPAGNKFFTLVFQGLAYLSGVGISFLFMSVWWGMVRAEPINILNPFIALEILFSLVKLPLFWILTVTLVLGHFTAKGAAQPD